MFVVLPLVQAAFVLLVLFFQRRTNEESEDGLLQDAITWSALDDAVLSTPSFMEERASGAASRACCAELVGGRGSASLTRSRVLSASRFAQEVLEETSDELSFACEKKD